MTTVRRGYTVQFARRPQHFCGVLTTTVRSKNAQVLRAEVMNLLEKGAIEIIPPAQSESGFYSRYFFIPKKVSGLRTYSRSQTPELRPDEKVVQDDHFETDPPANMPRGLVHVAVSERCILSHPGSPHHRRIRNVSCAANQHIRMISEGSCDAEDCSNDAENSALHHRNKLNLLAIYQNKNFYFQYYCFYWIFE